VKTQYSNNVSLTDMSCLCALNWLHLTHWRIRWTNHSDDLEWPMG